VGLADYVGSLPSKLALTFGVCLLASAFAISNGAWTPSGWSDLIKEGSNIRLPGALARAIGKPEWGTETGVIHLTMGKNKIRLGVEKATLRPLQAKEIRLNVKTLEGFVFEVKVQLPEGESADVLTNPAKLIGPEWPLVFKDILDAGESEGTLWTFQDGSKLQIHSGSFRIDKIENGLWEGIITLTPLTGEPTKGSFEKLMVKTSEAPKS
jgi:hypothetical protein